MPDFTEAVIYAARMHQGQVYPRVNVEWPFLVHPLAVALHFEDEYLRIIGVLHDVVEDTPATISEVDRLFGARVSATIDALTRRDGEPYEEYIARLSKNPDAAQVKMADLELNLKHCQRPDAPRFTASLITRYEKALVFLKEASHANTD